MIKKHGFPYFPVVFPIGFLTLIGIITLNGGVSELHLVYGAIVAPILLVLGAFSYKALTAKDNED
jgi:formate hydrogenlyase subunit 3/multisubunit Na+/H+ antiporter MnhD subunit